MQGKGLVKRVKQIQIAGQSIYLLVAITLILLKFNLIAVVSAQVLSIIVRRTLSYLTVYTKEFKNHLSVDTKYSKDEIMKSIYPNALKLGFVNIGNAVVTRSSVIIGALYLTLNNMASYGITIQIVWVLASVGTVYFSTFIPKIIQYRAQNNETEIVKIYLFSCLFLVLTFLLGGCGLLFFGDKLLTLIASKTHLLPKLYIVIILIVLYFDNNRGMAEWVLSTKNEIPFFKASLFAGGFMLFLLFVFLKYTNLGVWSLILAPGIAQGCYQNWKWPLVVFKELNIKFFDIYHSINLAMHQIKRSHL
jgi:O-antigen/teichoic acid export membrane protein